MAISGHNISKQISKYSTSGITTRVIDTIPIARKYPNGSDDLLTILAPCQIKAINKKIVHGNITNNNI